jgi:translation initiation factor IF-3
VRVIAADGKQLGVMTASEAQTLADEQNLDLVEVAAAANPPVCKIMDFHKYRYEQRKKSHDSKKKPAAAMKEVKIRSRTEAHDIAFKTDHIRKFLEKGHRVKISVFFKGREITRPEFGRKMLERVLASIAELAAPEGEPRIEGRHMSVVVVPQKGKAQGAKHDAPPVKQEAASPAAKQEDVPAAPRAREVEQ